MEHIVDIHMHIVPGVDDGARDVSEALAEVRMAREQGVDVMFATPHSFAFDGDHERVRKQFDKLKREAKDYEPSVRIIFGCEVYIYLHNAEKCVRRLDAGIYPCMGDTRYVLIEFDPYGCTQEEAEYCIRKITDAGYIPIIAHVERYHFATLDGCKAMKELGAMLQINAYDVVQVSDRRIRTLTNELLAAQMADFFGTDSHRLSHRPPQITVGAEAIERLYTIEYARKIFTENPHKMLIKEQDCTD